MVWIVLSLNLFLILCLVLLNLDSKEYGPLPFKEEEEENLLD